MHEILVAIMSTVVGLAFVLIPVFISLSKRIGDLRAEWSRGYERHEVTLAGLHEAIVSRFAGMDQEKNRILADANREHERLEALLRVFRAEFDQCKSNCRQKSDEYIRHHACLDHLCREVESLKNEVSALRELIMEGKP